MFQHNIFVLEPDFSINTEYYCPPRNTNEEELCRLWADILALEKIGIRDDFFKVGGDSILLMQLVERMRYELNLKVSMNDIFIYRTIEKLILSRKNRTSNDMINRRECFIEEIKETSKLLPIQKWFFSQSWANINAVTQIFAIKTPTLEVPILKKAIEKLFKHHATFRLRFNANEGFSKISQYYSENVWDYEFINLNVESVG